MTIQEAKDLYIKYDCSLFAMAREEKNKYEKYKALEISNEEEKSKSKENISIMEKTLEYIKYDSLEIKVSISETILGRKDISVRSGLVFAAYDLQENDLARRFLLFVNNILACEISHNDITSRVERAILLNQKTIISCLR